MLKILVVDDSRYQRYTIQSVLSKYGKCDEAADGKEALRLFTEALQQEAGYDLIIMDILMPVMNGHEALKKIMNIQKLIPETAKKAKAIMLSSLDDPQNMMEAQFDSGAEYYITKPFEEDTLVEALQALDLIDGLLEDEETF